MIGRNSRSSGSAKPESQSKQWKGVKVFFVRDKLDKTVNNTIVKNIGRKSENVAEHETISEVYVNITWCQHCKYRWNCSKWNSNRLREDETSGLNVVEHEKCLTWKIWMGTRGTVTNLKVKTKNKLRKKEPRRSIAERLQLFFDAR